MKVFSTFHDCFINKFWLIIRFSYFFINMHAQIEKIIPNIRSILWNASMKVSLKTSFGAKCGVENLALLVSNPFGVLYLGPVVPHWPNAPNTLNQDLICEMVFILDLFFNWFFLNQQILVDWQIFLLFNQWVCPNWKINHKTRLATWNVWMEISQRPH